MRPVVVINDPQLSASQPADALAASSANALGHAEIREIYRTSAPTPSPRRDTSSRTP